MLKIVPLLALTFYSLVPPSLAQTANKRADRKVVTPGLMAEPKIFDKSRGAVAQAPITTAFVTTAFVRILHAVPGGPQIDVFAGSLKLASNRGFSGITSYLPVKSGKNVLKVFNAGNTSPIIVTDAFTFARGKYYTVAIYGKKAPVLLSINESSGKENLEKARVRAVHLSPGAPELLVTIPSTRGDLGYAKLVSKPLEYGKSSSKLLAAKSTTVQVRTEEKLLKETPEMNFEAGKRYSAFIIGEVGVPKTGALDVLIKPSGN